MTKKIDFAEAPAPISLQEYLEFCDRNVDPDDVESVLESAPMLRALAGDRTFLIEKINEYFRHAGVLEELNTYSAQALILAVRPNYMIRTNTWVAPKVYARDDAWERTLYSYGFAHNHNFNLLTVGYFGPGYTTDLYRLDAPENIVGYLGEEVEMTSMGQLRVGQGDVLLYERVTDIHIQNPPEELSISINLMPIDSRLSLTEQFGFDVVQKRITSLVGSQVAQQTDMLRIAACLGDGNTADVILNIGLCHPNQSTRLGALHAACAMLPNEDERIWQLGLKDKSDLVRTAARRMLQSEAPMMI